MGMHNEQAFKAVCDGEGCCRGHGYLTTERGELASILRIDGWQATRSDGGGYHVLCPDCKKKPAEAAATAAS
jgi:hypothetical protein